MKLLKKNEWMDICRFNIHENYVFNGFNFYKQRNDVSKGNSFSSLFADIYLHMYERSYLNANDVFGLSYIDDLILFNINEHFLWHLSQRIILKKTNSNNTEANYLDLDIKINIRSTNIGLYDKRRDFQFTVKCLSHFFSNLNSKIFNKIYFTQNNRIKSICNNDTDLKTAYSYFRDNLSLNCFPSKYLNAVDILLRRLA